MGTHIRSLGKPSALLSRGDRDSELYAGCDSLRRIELPTVEQIALSQALSTKPTFDRLTAPD